jgi:hypothetical protein
MYPSVSERAASAGSKRLRLDVHSDLAVSVRHCVDTDFFCLVTFEFLFGFTNTRNNSRSLVLR